MKIGIITQARTGSSRLPKKVLLPIKKKTLLEYHIERLQQANLPVYVATTRNEEDDEIVKIAHQKQVRFSRGSETDVLCRYYSCAKENDLDFIVRVTSDCPLIDAGLIARGVSLLEERGFGSRLFISNTIERTFPRGFDFSLFSFQLLEEAQFRASDPYLREHVTPYFHQNVPGDIEHCSIRHTDDFSHFRITVDQQEDFLLVKRLIEDYGCEDKNYQEIIQVMVDHPGLAEINAAVRQKEK